MNQADNFNAFAAQTVPCPNCGTENTSDSSFCYLCGSPLKAAKSEPAFTPVEEPKPVAEPAPVETTSAFVPVEEPKPVEAPAEPVSAFAEGLPAWDIVPPQVVVRRR